MPAQGGLLKFLDAYVAFHGDMSGLDSDIAKAEGKAKAAGDRVERSFNPRRVLGALATAAAAGFAAMTRGSIALNETLTNVEARSGAVGAQWDAMSNAIQRQNRRTTLSLDEIGDGVQAIHTDLGAVGDEVGLASDRLTDFGLVAEESFAGAVRGADDLKDAYETTLLEALGILDALVVSHRTYGGSLIANRDALVAMAPAIRAANLQWQDGLALINLFNAAGVDATAIPVALQRALATVQSPAELQRLIADISATEDPFLRAEKAADLFGTRAGAKMAAALAPGRGALADYVIDVDEAAGATEEAARKIDSSWTRFGQLIAQNIEGAASSVGNAIGPLLEILASVGTSVTAIALLFPGLGPKVVTGLKAMFTRVTPTAIANGAAMGTASGLAFSAAFTVAAVAAVAATFLIIKDQIDQQGAALQAQAGDFVKTASLEALQQARRGVEQDLAQSKEGFHPIEDFLGLSATPHIQGVLDKLDAEIARRTGEIGSNAGTAASENMAASAAATIAASRALIEAATIEAFGGVPVGIAGVTRSARDAIRDMLAAAASEIESRRSGIDALIDRINENRKKKPLTQTQELERLLQARASKALADELHSPDLQRRLDARALAAALDDAIADLRPRPGIMSDVSKGLIADLKTSTVPELKAFAAWFQLEFNRAAAAIAAEQIPLEFGPGGKKRPGDFRRREIKVENAVETANALIGSKDATAAAIHELLKGALASSDLLIRADAQAEGLRFAESLTDAIDSPTSKANATASMRELAQAAVDFLRSGQAKSMVESAWNALTSGLTLQVPSLSGLPIPVPGPDSRGSLVPSFASGLPYVPFDMFAGIHQREAVLTPSEADAWRSRARGDEGPREQHFHIDQLVLADAHDEFSMTQQLEFLAGLG
jgi:hypothetical protein